MKQRSLKLILSLAATVAVSGASAQTVTWSAPMSVAASSFKNGHPRVVLAANGNPIVLWGNSSSRKAFLSRWTGSAFSTPVQMNTTGVNVFADSWAGPDIAAKGDTVYVIYKVEPENTSGIFIRKSVDGGATFGMEMRVDNITGFSSRFPSVATDAAGQPIVAFMKADPGPTKERYVITRSMNFGNSFMADVKASGFNMDSVCNCCPGSIVSNGNTVAMLYRNNQNNKRTSWAGISTDGGATFPSGMEVDNTNWNIPSCPSSGPDGVIVGDTLYTTFMSAASGGSKVYWSKSKISTMSSGTSAIVTGTSTGINSQNYPRAAADGKTVVIAWVQQENLIPQIGMLLAKDVEKGFSAWEKPVVNPSGSNIMNVDVAVKNGVVHLVWEDMSSGTVKYQKGTINNPTTAGISTASKNELSVYPVPANDELRITLAQAETRPCALSITDASGRIAFQKGYSSINSTLKVNTSDFPAGIYLLKLSTEAGVITNKFVVSR